MSNSVGNPPPGSSSNESLPLQADTNSTPSSGPSPTATGEESSAQFDDSATPPPNSTNADSPPKPSSPPPTSKSLPPPSPPPPPPPKSNHSPPPSPPLVSNSTKSNSSPPLIISPPPNSPPPSPSPPPTPAKKDSSSSSVLSPPPPAASPPPADIFVQPPLSGDVQQAPPPLAEFKPSLSPPFSNMSPKTLDSNSIPSNSGRVLPDSRFHSPPVPGTSPPDDPSSTSTDAGNYNVPRTPPAPANESIEGGSKTIIAAAVGAAVTGLFLLTLIAAIFLVVKSRKKRETNASGHYMPPKNFTLKSTDGYHYGQQQQSVRLTGPGSPSYHLQSAPSESHGSQRGNMYNGGGPDSDVIGSGKTFFSYNELMEITNGFARQYIIGEGGFGCVYKGCMADGKVVAVKQLKAGSGQGDREFKAEVEIISRVHHRHLVSLVGYCISDNQRLLIYEFVPNKTLQHHLHEKELPVLDWPKRLRIAIGSAKGLAYLHEDCHPKIIHRDIKSANILLDDVFEAQVADFGLARLNDTTQTHVSTRVMGTFGYLAPEYASSGKLTDRSDVFSFGVVLLELITGRKPVDAGQPLGDESLVEWARPLLIHALETGELGELVDPRLEKHYVESELFRMVETAAACVRHSAPKRPRMMQVVRALDSEGELSDLSNGVKFGQSTAYDSGQYNQEIRNFRRMALVSNGSSEIDTFSGDHSALGTSCEHPTSGDYTSSESETRAMNRPEAAGLDKGDMAKQQIFLR